MTDVLICAAGFTAGNFIFQAIGDGNYSQAVECSFFQLCALLFFYWLNREKWRTS